MGFFDNMKIDKLGRDAYNAHVQANDFGRRGKVADARAKYNEAMQLYGKAYEAGCRKSGILISYSVLLMRFGEFERARELMKEISANGGLSEESHFELRVNYSICLWRLGILDKAIDTIRYAGKHAKNSSYYSGLCTFLVELAGRSGELADFEEARVVLDEAMEYDDEDASTLDSYGEYYRQQAIWAQKRGEDFAELRKTSIDFFERAHKAKPSQITTLHALARYCIEDGDKARAAQLLDKAIMHYSSKVCPVSLEELKAMKAGL
ncbi:MAG: hypothetical protein IJ466_07775 [Clostridia bacterium]|nr:hypothetical protein [Clostridia bacterium]